MATMSIQLYLGDCLEILPTLEAGSRSDPAIVNGLYAFECRDGQVTRVLPMVQTLDLRTEEEL